jgi:hypothetical protein
VWRTKMYMQCMPYPPISERFFTIVWSLSICTFSFGHCVVCTFSIYGIWLPPFDIFKLFFYCWYWHVLYISLRTHSCNRHVWLGMQNVGRNVRDRYDILAYITKNYIALIYYAKIVHRLCQFHAGKVGFSAVCQAIYS